jgi:hypothetical protein
MEKKVFSVAYLEGADLECADLEGTDLEGTDLEGANWPVATSETQSGEKQKRRSEMKKIDKQSLITLLEDCEDCLNNGNNRPGCDIRYNPQDGTFKIEHESFDYDNEDVLPICKFDHCDGWLGFEVFQKNEIEQMANDLIESGWLEQSLNEIQDKIEYKYGFDEENFSFID